MIFPLKILEILNLLNISFSSFEQAFLQTFFAS